MVELFLKMVLSWTPKFRLQEENGFHRSAMLITISITNLIALPIMGFHFQKENFQGGALGNLALASLSFLAFLLIKTKISTMAIEYLLCASFLITFGIKASLHTGILSPFAFFLLLPAAYMFLILRPKHGLVQTGLALILLGVSDYATSHLIQSPQVLSSALVRTVIIQFFTLITFIFLGFNYFLGINQDLTQKFRLRAERLGLKNSDQNKEILQLRIKNEALEEELKGFMGNSDLQMIAQTKDIKSKLHELNHQVESSRLFQHNLLSQLLSKTNHLHSHSSHLSLSQFDKNNFDIIQNINKESKDILDLVRNATEIADGLNHTSTVSDFDLRQLLIEITENSNLHTDNLFLTFHLKTDFQVPRYLNGNFNLLSRALSALIQHSYAITPKGNIYLYVIQTKKHYNTIQLRFILRDSGMVLNRQEALKLFSPFAPLSLYPSHAGNISGLELALAKKWIAELGGKIDYNKEAGHGNQIEVELEFQNSLLNKSFPQLLDHQMEDTLFPSISIAIIDQSKINQNLIEKHFRTFHIKYHYIKSTEALHHYLASNSPDFIFCDLDDFHHQYENIYRELSQAGHTTEWILMGNSQQEHLLEIKTINKPVRSDEIFNVIKQHIHLNLMNI